MIQTRHVCLALAAALFCVLPFGCVDDINSPAVEEPGVVQQDTSFWAGDVMVNQRETIILSYDVRTHQFRGSVKNMGTTTLPNARFEVLTSDVWMYRDGIPRYSDEEIGVTQSFGNLAPLQELPINTSYGYPSVSNRRIRTRFAAN